VGSGFASIAVPFLHQVSPMERLSDNRVALHRKNATGVMAVVHRCTAAAAADNSARDQPRGASTPGQKARDRRREVWLRVASGASHEVEGSLEILPCPTFSARSSGPTSAP
jgi:hypothetical protein